MEIVAGLTIWIYAMTAALLLWLLMSDRFELSDPRQQHLFEMVKLHPAYPFVVLFIVVLWPVIFAVIALEAFIYRAKR